MQRLKKIGNIKAKKSSEIKSSKIGIGFEKLDRNVFDPEKAYDKIADIGVKWVRIQSGWARTEKEKGIYDFEWLDSIVDNLCKRGMKPWICLCYGNGLYNDDAQKVFGAVGCPPIHTDEQKQAWANYVKAVVSRYNDKVEYYEVWNEPDGKWCWKHGVNATEYGNFVIDTAKAIKEINKTAKVIGGSACRRSLTFFNDAFKTGMGDYIDAITFHEYTIHEFREFERVKALRGLLKLYNPDIKIIQGESGSQSRSGGAGAVRNYNWTQKKQAKQLARHTLADLMCDVEFMSYFSTMDMIEALNGIVDNKNSYLDYGYFGVIGADFDEDGFSTGEYTPKLSYRTLQVIASIFSESCTLAELITMIPFNSIAQESNWCGEYDKANHELVSGGFKKDNGSEALVYWYPSNIITTEYEGTISLQIITKNKNFKLVDVIDGSVYEIPEELIEDNGNDCYTFNHIPVKDTPLILTSGEFCEYDLI